MFDIYNNRIPFGLLTREEQGQLKKHKGEFDHHCFHNGRAFWGRKLYDCWYGGVVYRAVKSAPTPDIVPWDAIDQRWKWYTRDGDGTGCFYTSVDRPILGEVDWQAHSGSFVIDNLLKIVRGTCRWDESLQQRPQSL